MDHNSLELSFSFKAESAAAYTSFIKLPVPNFLNIKFEKSEVLSRKPQRVCPDLGWSSFDHCLPLEHPDFYQQNCFSKCKTTGLFAAKTSSETKSGLEAPNTSPCRLLSFRDFFHLPIWYWPQQNWHRICSYQAFLLSVWTQPWEKLAALPSV